MQGLGQLEVTEGVVETSTDVLGMRLDALVSKPGSNLISANYERAGTFGDCHGIPNMIAVPVGDEDEICINCTCFNHCGGVVVQERINEQLNAIYVEAKGGVSVPGNFERHVSLRNLSSESRASIDLSAVTCQSERLEPVDKGGQSDSRPDAP